jgi:D-alanyl-D-alanine carboxypeptidase
MSGNVSFKWPPFPRRDTKRMSLAPTRGGVKMNFVRRAMFAVLAALTLVAPAHGAAPKRANLTSIARELVRLGAPGAIVYVRTPTGTRAGVAGYADRDAHLSMRANDRYRIASVTKAFVSALILQLEAEGKLSIDDPVEKYLPHVVPNGNGISLRELMNHTSGLFNYTDDSAFVNDPITSFSRAWAPSELLALAFAHPPNFAPGTNWSYSNTNYIVLGLIVEAVTGKALGDVLQERIFTPLGLTSTSFPLTIQLAPDFVHGYVKLPSTPLIDITPGLNPSWGWAAGGIVSTPHDVTTFYRALMTGKLLPASQLDEMETPSAVNGTYGLGIALSFVACGRVFSHQGDFLGWQNIASSTANGKRQAVLMVNVNLDDDRVLGLWQKALCRG